MRIGIPIWEGRVSPVFDVARTLLIVDLAKNRETTRNLFALEGNPLPARAVFLQRNGVDVILCGAVSDAFLQLLVINSIRVYPWLSGDAEEILSAFLKGAINQPRYIMPGCCRRMRRRGKGSWGSKL